MSTFLHILITTHTYVYMHKVDKEEPGVLYIIMFIKDLKVHISSTIIQLRHTISE